MPTTLTQITITRLFGMFDHEINLNQKERITIITAPNGFGKTVLLRLTSAFFNGRFHEFYRASFNEFTLRFENGALITLRKSRPEQQPVLFSDTEQQGLEEEKAGADVEVVLELPRSEPQSWKISAVPSGLSANLIERYVPSLERVGPRVWLDVASGRQMSFNCGFAIECLQLAEGHAS
jgi:hypothetical protein